MRRVVVTGLGPVTPVGIGREAFWDALTAGRSGIGEVTSFDAGDLPVRIAGEVTGFDPADHLSPKEVRRTDRVVHLGVAAARLAWEDAGRPAVEPARAAVVIATGIGGFATMEEQARVMLERGPSRVSPFTVPAMMPNAAAGHVAMELGLTGPNMCIVHRVRRRRPRHRRGASVRAGRSGRRVRGGRDRSIGHAAGDGGVRADGRAVEEPRPGSGLSAVRQGTRRVRALGGSVRAGPRRAGARGTPGGHDLRGGGRIRRVGGRLSRHPARAERGGSHPRDARRRWPTPARRPRPWTTSTPTGPRRR